MTTHSYAVQPTAFGDFDEHGCDWAINLSHAYKLCAIWGEDMTVWAIPNNPKAEPYRWVNVAKDGSI